MLSIGIVLLALLTLSLYIGRDIVFCRGRPLEPLTRQWLVRVVALSDLPGAGVSGDDCFSPLLESLLFPFVNRLNRKR
jgi:hypothetical protein